MPPASRSSSASTRSSSTCLRYREVEKLRSTYGEGLLAEVGPDGRIHATFNQTVARTGRLSSDAPNLHNIPVRREVGRGVPHGVRPRRRLRAAGGRLQPDRAPLHRPPGRGPRADRRLRDAAGTSTPRPPPASSASRPTASRSSSGRRRRWSPTAWPTAWRPTDWASACRSPPTRRPTILDAYFVAFPAVRAYMDQTVAEARERGYTETLFGRRRRQIPELSSRNFRIRQAGERQAMNAGHPGPGRRHLQGRPRPPRPAPCVAGGLDEPADPAGPRRGPARGRPGRARRHDRA